MYTVLFGENVDFVLNSRGDCEMVLTSYLLNST